MIKENVLLIAFVLSILLMIGSSIVLADSSDSMKPKDPNAVQKSQSDSATRNPALVNPSDPTGVNSNIPGARPSTPAGGGAANSPSGANPGGTSSVNPGIPSGAGAGAGGSGN